eukprot:Awhi_evm1s12938
MALDSNYKSLFKKDVTEQDDWPSCCLYRSLQGFADAGVNNLNIYSDLVNEITMAKSKPAHIQFVAAIDELSVLPILILTQFNFQLFKLNAVMQQEKPPTPDGPDSLYVGMRMNVGMLPEDVMVSFAMLDVIYNSVKASGKGKVSMIFSENEGELEDICQPDVAYRKKRYQIGCWVCNSLNCMFLLQGQATGDPVMSSKESSWIPNKSYDALSKQDIEDVGTKLSDYIIAKAHGADAVNKRYKRMSTKGHKSMVGRTCNTCGNMKDKLNACARCKDAFYCSRECQKEDWKTHKLNCQKKEAQSGALPYCTLPRRLTPYDTFFNLGAVQRRNLTLKNLATAYFKDVENLFCRVILEDDSISAIRSTQIIMPAVDFRNTSSHNYQSAIPTFFFMTGATSTKAVIEYIESNSKKKKKSVNLITAVMHVDRVLLTMLSYKPAGNKPVVSVTCKATMNKKSGKLSSDWYETDMKSPIDTEAILNYLQS